MKAIPTAIPEVLIIEPAVSWSDGTSGASGAVPEHLRECVEGFEYCKVKVSGCGGCHGDWDAMNYQRQTGPNEPVNVPVVDRISDELTRVQLHRVLDAFKSVAERR